jgi:hypothetical protein
MEGDSMSNLQMKNTFKLLAWLIGISLAAGLFFADNIRGYYRFKEICARDAGLRVYQPLERNVGWTVSGGRIEDTSMPIYMNEVAFVRYRNETDDMLYDVYRVQKLKVGDSGYAQQAADLNKPVVYEYRSSHRDLKDEVRLGAWITEFIDLRTSKIAATYSEISYGKFNTENSILAAPSGEACPDDVFRRDQATGKALPMKRDLAISTMFIQ